MAFVTEYVPFSPVALYKTVRFCDIVPGIVTMASVTQENVRAFPFSSVD